MTLKDIEGCLMNIVVTEEMDSKGQLKNLNVPQEIKYWTFQLRDSVEKLLLKRKDKQKAMDKIIELFNQYNKSIEIINF